MKMVSSFRAEVSTTGAGYLYKSTGSTDMQVGWPGLPNGYLAPGRHKLPRPGWRMTAGALRWATSLPWWLRVRRDLLAIDARAGKELIEVEGPYAAAMHLSANWPEAGRSRPDHKKHRECA